MASAFFLGFFFLTLNIRYVSHISYLVSVARPAEGWPEKGVAHKLRSLRQRRSHRKPAQHDDEHDHEDSHDEHSEEEAPTPAAPPAAPTYAMMPDAQRSGEDSADRVRLGCDLGRRS